MPWPLFHYFVQAQLEAIWTSGVLRPAGSWARFGGAFKWMCSHWGTVTDIFCPDASERIRLADLEPPAVWCSRDPVWEDTIGRSLVGCDGNVYPLKNPWLPWFPGMLARIQVDPDSCPVTWEAHFASWLPNYIHDDARQRYYSAGVDPGVWRLSYEPIPRDRWLGIHVWDGKVWGLPPPAFRIYR
jgi:hypothetical protein